MEKTTKRAARPGHAATTKYSQERGPIAMNSVDYYKNKYCSECKEPCKQTQLELTSCLLTKIDKANQRIQILEKEFSFFILPKHD
jgi:hypothetical protein